VTSPQPDPAAVAAALAYQQQTQAVRAAIAAYIARLWRSLGQWRRPQIPQFTKQLVPVVLGSQRQMASLTSAYLAAQRQIALGGRLIPTPLDPKTVIGAAARNGTPPADVYERPFHLVWRQLDELPREPGSIDQAIQSGLDRAVQLAITDLQLTKVQTSQQVLTRDKHVTGYRRVIEGAHSCGLCIVASTQRYHRTELLPIHPACDCSVAPIYGDTDPGQVIDPKTLSDLHERLAETFGADASSARTIPGAAADPVQYRDVLVQHEHGELGPVLGVRGEKFLGPGENDIPSAPGGGGGKPPTPPDTPTPPGPSPEEPVDPFEGVPTAPESVTKPDLDLLTGDEENEIAYYTASSFKAINEALRAGRAETAGTSVRNSIAAIDSGLAKYPLPMTIRTSRGVTSRMFNVDSPEELANEVGSLFVENGFMSTTVDAVPDPGFFTNPDDVILSLVVPAGTPALFLRALSMASGENELLLARGRTLQIVKARYDQDLERWVVYATVAREGSA
jgi:flavin-binding protein dodecin